MTDITEFVDYIRCYNPKNFKRPAWKSWDTILKHIDEIVKAYELMVYENYTLSQATRAVTRNYRRLEATMKELKLVYRVGIKKKRYVPAGVLCECRVYLTYLNTKPSWRRKAEIQFLVVSPLGTRCSELISPISLAHDIMDNVGIVPPWDREYFDGCDRVDCGRMGKDCWCNYKERKPIFNYWGELEVEYQVDMFRWGGFGWVYYATYDGVITTEPKVVKK